MGFVLSALPKAINLYETQTWDIGHWTLDVGHWTLDIGRSLTYRRNHELR